jgi:hypothetical protein
VSLPLGENVWVFHAGALGDHVMIWPLVRALARQGTRVTVVAAGSHAELCEREIGAQAAGAGRVVGVDAEAPRMVHLWRGAEGVREEWVDPGVSAVVTFVAAPDAEGGARWHAGAARMFPNAERVSVGRPDTEDGAAGRGLLWERARVGERGGVEALRNPSGPIVLYLGAGAAGKRLSDGQWVGVVEMLMEEEEVGDSPIHLVVGRNEVECGVTADGVVGAVGRRARVRGVVCGDARALADEVRGARVVAGGDTGPVHLSAQLGVPTLAIFGPTDPRVWSPVGPRVRVMAAASGVVGEIEAEGIVREIVGLAEK